VVVLVFFDAGAKLRDDFVGALNIFRSLRAHAGHVHVVAVGIIVAGCHVLHGGLFAGFFIAHVHSGHGFGLRRGGFLSGRVLSAGRTVAGHGD